MIEPTVGRIVHFYATASAVDDQPQPAIITHVWTDRSVSLNVFGDAGLVVFTSVQLRQPDEDYPTSGPWCQWMPYQVKKPTGSESGERAGGTEVI